MMAGAPASSASRRPESGVGAGEGAPAAASGRVTAMTACRVPGAPADPGSGVRRRENFGRPGTPRRRRTLTLVITSVRASRRPATHTGPDLEVPMGLFSSHRTEMVTADRALPGRPTPITEPGRHRVLGTPLAPPFPEGLQIAYFAMGCFWGAERKFWETEGVYST